MDSNQYDDLKKMIDDLRRELRDDIKDHEHDGLESRIIDLDTDVQGLYQTVSSVPTNIPKGPYDQVKIYSSAGTFRLYIYDAVGHLWKYATLT